MFKFTRQEDVGSATLDLIKREKGYLWFSAFALAFLFLLIKLCIDDPPKSFKEFICCFPKVLGLVIVFPIGLGSLLLPKGFDLEAFLPIGYIVYIAHGIATACAQNRKTICTLLTILVILLLVNIYGCSVMLKGL